MKISVLIAQYFYQNKVLNLPGIGSFYLDESVDASSIGNKSDLLEHIHFAQKAITRPDDSLIEFIRKHTGKIKPLAESDLDTFVADGKLMLNIGKPFHVDGVGTLQKNKDGVYEFTPGAPVVQRLEPLPPVPVHEWQEERPIKKKSVFDENSYDRGQTNTKRLLMAAGIVVGLAIIIWGGYSVYSSKTNDTTLAATTPTASSDDTTSRVSNYVHNIDSPAQALERVISKDSAVLDEGSLPPDAGATTVAATTTPAPAAPLPAGRIKYVLETFSRKASAEKRYNLLKPRVQLEAVDSSLFNIYITLAGTAADTTRQKDSLHNWYWGARRDRSVKIER